MKSKPYFLQISPDLHYVTLHSFPAGQEPVQLSSSEELIKYLDDQAIVYGRDEQVIAQACSLIDNDEYLDTPLILAKGTAPIEAREGLQVQFDCQTLLINEVDESGAIHQSPCITTPLVRKGEILAAFVSQSSHPGVNVLGKEILCSLQREQVFIPGEHVLFNDDSSQLVATASGYPVIVTETKGAIDHLTLHIEKVVQVAANQMQAVLVLQPPPLGNTYPTIETILHILDEEKIVFGRLPNAISRCLENLRKEQKPQQAVIALGTLPIKGKDAYLHFEMEIGPLPGKLMGNGEIDFRERNMFIGVSKKQLIAVKIPPTAGTPGRDIYGSQVPQEPGKDIIINVTDDAAFDPSTNEIRASRSGVLTNVSETSIKVSSKQIIAQDVDFQTGNITSHDSLEIKGSIKPKFKVQASGDILIRGTIEKAQVKSSGNVVVQSALIGEQADIQTKGDVDIKIVEHGRISAGGSIILRTSAYFCRMFAGVDIRCDSSSRIIHSQLIAAGSITVGTVGSDNADPSFLAAAVSPEQFQRYCDIRRTIDAQSKEIKTLRMRIGHGMTSDELEELILSLEENERQLQLLNLIYPDTVQSPDKGLSHAMQCSLTVQGKIFAGTEIRIGNSSMVLETTMSNIQFHLPDLLIRSDHKSKHGILAIPLSK